jgi:hypothetical protein
LGATALFRVERLIELDPQCTCSADLHLGPPLAAAGIPLRDIVGLERCQPGLNVLLGQDAEHLFSHGKDPVQFLALVSAPIARAASAGRLLVSVPSTSVMPPNSAGAIAPGTDMLARITFASSPSLTPPACP